MLTFSLLSCSFEGEDVQMLPANALNSPSMRSGRPELRTQAMRAVVQRVKEASVRVSSSSWEVEELI